MWMIVIVFSLLLACLLAVLGTRWARRWWANRAHSLKVLDEIEMEFVDDIDDDLELLHSRHGSSSTAPRSLIRACIRTPRLTFLCFWRSGDGTPSRLPHSADAAWAASASSTR
jgi:hypothetical protein